MATVSQRQILDFFNWEKKTVSNEKQDGIDGGGESGGPSTVTTHAVAKTDDEGNMLMVISGDEADNEN
ncbi:hypothetical protein FGLOB1_4431 [Fusarium globosum]|uniref:Uncharacterized protein n=1 Tax=Fusarium globosum TaxID=78864 RepID=A0A8H5YHF2_9HYPO|nr:hypothetical protein FGLOB1_4431 [Fusarium globosum]